MTLPILRIATLSITLLCLGIAKGENVQYTSLEFEDVGVSFEVPSEWYTHDNGSTKTISKLASEWSKRQDIDIPDRTLISMIDEPDIRSNTSSSITILYSSEVLVTQAQIADANAAQKKILLEHWTTTAPEQLRTIANSVEIIDAGEILQIGNQWFVKVSMNVQMRSDMPTKRKTLYIHMSQKGTIHLTFTCIPEKASAFEQVRDYVIESLRMNALRRAG
jgi:hypothetical protein